MAREAGGQPPAFLFTLLLTVACRLLTNTPMTPDDIAPEFRTSPKDYARPAPIEGVRVLRLNRFTDDRGFFLEIFRAKANPPVGKDLAEFFQDVPVGQMNFSIVDAEGHIKGLHYHLKQDDIWFVPPPSKAKFVLFDVRKASPTFGRTQVIVAGGGQDLLVRIPAGVAHGYRPLTNPCALFYFVTQTFDPAAPDELRIAWNHPAVKDLWEVPNG
jgi:dTDP-4-dehydrorhamnose 3,5-epimerase